MNQVQGGRECKMSVGSAKVKMCAFCKYWYDPNNETISPKAPAIGLWEYDEKAKRKCLKNGLNMSSRASCGKYECKI